MKRTQNLSTHNLTVMAALVAMQIILARFLSIQVSDILRISFESIPVILAGLWLGPVNGAIVALVADFLGTIIHGYGAWFPPLALGPISVAVICGLGARHILGGDLTDRRGSWKLIGLVLVAGLLNSFFFGLIGSTLYSIVMKGNTTAFSVLLWSNLLGRLGTKPVVIAVDTALVFLINRTVYKPVIARILSRA